MDATLRAHRLCLSPSGPASSRHGGCRHVPPVTWAVLGDCGVSRGTDSTHPLHALGCHPRVCGKVSASDALSSSLHWVSSCCFRSSSYSMSNTVLCQMCLVSLLSQSVACLCITVSFQENGLKILKSKSFFFLFNGLFSGITSKTTLSNLRSQMFSLRFFQKLYGFRLYNNLELTMAQTGATTSHAGARPSQPVCCRHGPRCPQ